MKLASVVKEDPNQVYARANGYLAKGCMDLAENLYFKLLNSRDNGSHLDVEIQADILHNLGMIAERRQNLDLAIEYYQQAVSVNQNRSMTWLFLAKSYLTRFEHKGNNKDLKAGFDAIHQAESDNPNYPVIRFLKQKFAVV